MKSCKSIISQHNKSALLKGSATSPANKSSTCNCRITKECPLQNKCQTKCVIYKAEVITSNSKPKVYICMTGNTFKERFNNHKKSFSKIEYRNSTKVSEYVWDLKEREHDFTIQ